MSLLHACARTCCCSNAQHDQGYCHVRGAQILHKLQTPPQSSMRQKGPWSKCHTAEQQILVSTVQNSVSKATDAPYLCTTAQTQRRYTGQNILLQGCRTYSMRAQNGTQLSRLSHFFSFFLSFARPASLHCEEYLYMYTHIWLCTDCVWITVATKQHCNETFSHKSEGCEVLTGYLSLGRRSGGDWANTWHWAERFTVCFLNRKQ